MIYYWTGFIPNNSMKRLTKVRELLGGDNNNVAAVDEDDEQLQHSNS